MVALSSESFVGQLPAALPWDRKADRKIYARLAARQLDRPCAISFQTLKCYFTNRQIVEMTFICGMWTLSARLTEPFHLDVELPEDRIDFNAKRGRDPKVSAA